MNRSSRIASVVLGGALLYVVGPLMAADGPLTSDLSMDVYATPAQRVDIGGGRHLNLRCSGSGSPTVLLEIGQGMTSMSWRKVQPLLAVHSRVCSYDRAGLGFSDAGPLPRTAQAAVDDLHALVRAAPIQTPLVLVGHSMGGSIVRLYAAAHPNEVAALVLVDPVVADLRVKAPKVAAQEAQISKENTAGTHHCLDLATSGALATMPPPADGCVHPAHPAFSEKLNDSIRVRDLNADFWAASLSEREAFPLNDAAVQALHPLGKLPLIILSADGTNDYLPPAARKAADVAYRAGQQRIAASSTQGRVMPVEHSSHNIQEDRPDAIIDAVARVIGQLRVGKPPM